MCVRERKSETERQRSERYVERSVSLKDDSRFRDAVFALFSYEEDRGERVVARVFGDECIRSSHALFEIICIVFVALAKVNVT